MIARFTGWHMTIVIVAFFAVVIAVNVVMAIAASRTFGGKVVDNSYVASQRFNAWLAEARAQQQLGWSGRISLNGGRRVTLDLARGGSSFGDAQVRAVARHPVGGEPDLALDFIHADGRYVSRIALPAGRWQIQAEARHQGRVVRFAATLS